MAGTITIELRDILDARGMTQKQLAQLTGIREARISQLCNGFVDQIGLDHVIKICDALKVTPSTWLIYVSEWMTEEDND